MQQKTTDFRNWKRWRPPRQWRKQTKKWWWECKCLWHKATSLLSACPHWAFFFFPHNLWSRGYHLNRWPSTAAMLVRQNWAVCLGEERRQRLFSTGSLLPSVQIRQDGGRGHLPALGTVPGSWRRLSPWSPPEGDLPSQDSVVPYQGDEHTDAKPNTH